MKKSLYELSLEYDEAIRQQQELTDRARIAFNDAKRRGDRDEVNRLGRKLEVYYAQIRDMRIVSRTLKDYYIRPARPDKTEVGIAV